MTLIHQELNEGLPGKPSGLNGTYRNQETPGVPMRMRMGLFGVGDRKVLAACGPEISWKLEKKDIQQRRARDWGRHESVFQEL